MLQKSARYLFLAIVLTSLFPTKLSAQIIPDNTLGAENSTIRSINRLKNAIEGGAIRENNLFHSFIEFSVQEGFTAEFTNPEGITNIFSRVTGSNISEIFGTLGVDGAANLFLMNPNGIIFGENTAININGSFLATTAESIEFNNGNRFSAVNNEKPLLTIDFPIGLGMGTNPGDIQVNGKESNILLEIPSFKVNTNSASSAIEVNSRENISFIAGNINFNGNGLKAPNGNIELISVDSNEAVKLQKENNWFKTDFIETSQFRDITLDGAAYIDVSGQTGGNIRLAGNNIILDGGSVILANTNTNSNNTIDINALGLLEIKGSTGKNQINVSPKSDRGIDSSIFSDKSNLYSISVIGADILDSTSEADTGSDINLNAKNISVFDSGQIRTVSFADSGAKAGDININAKNISVLEKNNVEGLITSVINSTTGIDTQGNAGDINISTSYLEVKNGGRIKADAFGAGSGGSIKIDAEQILLESYSGDSQFRTGLSISPGKIDDPAGNIIIKTQKLNIINSDISTTAFIEGNSGVSGEITIKTEELNISNGGAIRAESGGGDAENITINAKDIKLDGTRRSFADFSGGISTSTRFNSFGDGGDINITTNSLKIFNGAIIRAISLGTGDAGNISIDANTIEVSGFASFDENPVAPERISKINTGSLKSNGGELFINSESIEVRDFGLIQATTRGGLGNGGNITIDTDSLQLFNQANITASAEEASNGGNITINSDTIIGSNNSDITANAFEGNGGNIEVNSDVILGIESRGELTPNSDITASSDLGIDGTVTINSPDTNAEDEVLFSAKPPEPDRVKNLFDSSCLNPNRSKLARVILQGRGLPETPYNYFDRPTEEIQPPVEVIKKPQVEPEPQAQKSTPSDLIEPNAIEVDDDGRRFLVALTSEQIQSARVCQQQLDASES